MFRAITLLAIIAGPVAAESPWAGLPARPWLGLPAIEASEPAWVMWNVSSDDSDPYKDVHARGGTYKDVHEASHQVMNRLNNEWGFYVQRRYAVYVLRGRIAALREPPITLADIARAVATEDRKEGYQLYLVQQQRDWNSNPLYLLDEWAAYSNEWEWDHTAIGLSHAVAFNRYAAVLLDLSERCPGYDAKPLRVFVRWHAKRVEQQANEAKSQKPLSGFWKNRRVPSGQCATGNCR